MSDLPDSTVAPSLQIQAQTTPSFTSNLLFFLFETVTFWLLCFGILGLSRLIAPNHEVIALIVITSLYTCALLGSGVLSQYRLRRRNASFLLVFFFDFLQFSSLYLIGDIHWAQPLVASSFLGSAGTGLIYAFVINWESS